MRRVFLIVLDGVGIGALPDAAEYGDAGAHTLGHVYAQARPALPNLLALGLGNIENSGLPRVSAPKGGYGRGAERSRAKDTTTGHWEIAGAVTDPPFKVYPSFPPEALAAFESAIGRKTLGNLAASGTEILTRLGPEHLRTGRPIVYTSADSVFQIAAHEAVVPLAALDEFCQAAYEIFCGHYGVGRVIARPFTGAGPFTRTEGRRDFAVPPPPTILDALAEAGLPVLGIGKIEDIFARRGLTQADHTRNNRDGMAAALSAAAALPGGLAFVNLVDFDMLYGHRNDPAGFAQALEAFDGWLPGFFAALSPEDLVILTADHGCDPTTPSTDHSREYVPILTHGPTGPGPLGTRATFADIGASAYHYLTQGAWPVGETFLRP
jgi:phosphopentomutase